MNREAEDNSIDTLSDERRWDRQSRLVLALGILLIVWPVLTTLAILRHPTDGWSSASDESFAIGGQYRIGEPLTTLNMTLRTGDLVIAIDGRPLLPNTPPPITSDLAEGQVLRYTVERDGQTLDVDVTLMRLGPAALALDQLRFLLDLSSDGLFGFAMLAVATTVFLLRPGSLAARYLFLFAAFTLGIGLQIYPDLYAFTFPPWLSFLHNLFGFGWIYIYLPSLVLFVLVFPVRKWPVQRFPRLMPFVLIGLPLAGAVIVNAMTWFGDLALWGLWRLLTYYSFGWVLVLIPTTLIHNLLTIREPLARARMHWLALGLGLGFVAPMVLLIATVEILRVSEQWRNAILVLGSLATLILPISLAMGILRYRLFDIDVIIRRTTSYAIVSGLLALVYFGSIVVLQRLLTPMIGESDIAVVLSTLLIAILFFPVRRRVQNAIDRRFFRQKYDAEKVLEQFTQTVRDETDLDALTGELLRVIQETMQPEHVSLWLKPTGDQEKQN